MKNEAVRWQACVSSLTSPMSGRASGRSPLAKVRLDGPVMPQFEQMFEAEDLQVLPQALG